jgi:hypothetical protein
MVCAGMLAASSRPKAARRTMVMELLFVTDRNQIAIRLA